MTKSFRTLDDIGDVQGRRVLVREDLNVPLADGRVTDDTRLRATVATVAELADQGAIVLVLAHFGRPKGVPSAELSLAQIVKPYEAVLGRPVRYVDWEGAADAVATMQPGDIGVLENTRFFGGEEKNDPAVVARFAALGELYVNDAFPPRTAHMPRPRDWRTRCPRSPGARWRRSWTRWKRRWASPSIRSPRWSAGQRCRPSWTCSSIWWRRLIT